MTNKDTVVAFFDVAANAGAAVEALKAAGIAAADIDRNDPDNAAGRMAEATTTLGGGDGFWSRLFGGKTTREQNLAFDRTFRDAVTIVTVTLRDAERDTDHVMDILEEQDPVDVYERAVATSPAPRSATAR